MSTNDRRSQERHLACYPAGLKRAEGEPGLAWIRDLSVNGALLFADRNLTPGETLSLALHIADNPDEAREAQAKVVRVTQRPKDAGVWRYSVAVRFEPALEQWRAEIERMREKLPPAPIADR